MGKRFLDLLKTTLIGGFILLVPVVVLAIFLAKGLNLIRHASQYLSGLLPFQSFVGVAIIDIVGCLILLAVCLLAGIFARTKLAGKLVEKAEAGFLWRVPGYAFVKGFTDGLNPKGGAPSVKTVCCRFDDYSQIGFEVERLEDGRVVVYFPGAPEPWSGSVVIVDAERVQPLDATMLKAMGHLRQLGRGASKLLPGNPPAPG